MHRCATSRPLWAEIGARDNAERVKGFSSAQVQVGATMDQTLRGDSPQKVSQPRRSAGWARESCAWKSRLRNAFQKLSTPSTDRCSDLNAVIWFTSGGDGLEGDGEAQRELFAQNRTLTSTIRWASRLQMARLCGSRKDPSCSDALHHSYFPHLLERRSCATWTVARL